jgi:F-type H+-transporting ATPase subunit c
MSFIVSFLAEAAEYNEYYLKGMAAIGAALSILAGLGAGIGEGFIGGKTVEAISRNPEANDQIRSSMIISMALTETIAIYGLIVALLLIFVLSV